MTVSLWKLDPELAVERDGALHVGADDPECVQLRHGPDANG